MTSTSSSTSTSTETATSSSSETSTSSVTATVTPTQTARYELEIRIDIYNYPCVSGDCDTDDFLSTQDALTSKKFGVLYLLKFPASYVDYNFNECYYATFENENLMCVKLIDPNSFIGEPDFSNIDLYVPNELNISPPSYMINPSIFPPDQFPNAFNEPNVAGQISCTGYDHVPVRIVLNNPLPCWFEPVFGFDICAEPRSTVQEDASEWIGENGDPQENYAPFKEVICMDYSLHSSSSSETPSSSPSPITSTSTPTYSPSRIISSSSSKTHTQSTSPTTTQSPTKTPIYEIDIRVDYQNFACASGECYMGIDNDSGLGYSNTTTFEVLFLVSFMVNSSVDVEAQQESFNYSDCFIVETFAHYNICTKLIDPANFIDQNFTNINLFIESSSGTVSPPEFITYPSIFSNYQYPNLLNKQAIAGSIDCSGYNDINIRLVIDDPLPCWNDSNFGTICGQKSSTISVDANKWINSVGHTQNPSSPFASIYCKVE